jgi:H+-transporting ATPase
VLCLLVRSQVSLSDFLTVFAARTTGPFWSRKPAPILLGAFVVATTISTSLAMFWPFGTSSTVTMESISPKHALHTWIFCIVWFLIQDFVKVFYLKAVDRYKANKLAKAEREAGYLRPVAHSALV